MKIHDYCIGMTNSYHERFKINEIIGKDRCIDYVEFTAKDDPDFLKYMPIRYEIRELCIGDFLIDAYSDDVMETICNFNHTEKMLSKVHSVLLRKEHNVGTLSSWCKVLALNKMIALDVRSYLYCYKYNPTNEEAINYIPFMA